MMGNYVKDCRFVHSKFTNKPLKSFQCFIHKQHAPCSGKRVQLFELTWLETMKLATFTLLALAEAKLKLKSLDIPDKGFFFIEKSDEKHMGLPDDNKAYNPGLQYRLYYIVIVVICFSSVCKEGRIQQNKLRSPSLDITSNPLNVNVTTMAAASTAHLMISGSRTANTRITLCGDVPW